MHLSRKCPVLTGTLLPHTSVIVNVCAMTTHSKILSGMLDVRLVELRQQGSEGETAKKTNE